MKKEFSTVSVYNNNGNTVRVTVQNKEQERETAYQLKQLRFTFFVAELAMLSRKYGVAIQSTGGVCFGDFDGIEYSNDASSGDLTFNI